MIELFLSIPTDLQVIILAGLCGLIYMELFNDKM